MPKISELTTTSDLSGDELVPIVKAGTTQRTTVDAIREFTQFADYTAFRAYTGTARSAYVTGFDTSATTSPSGIAGDFTRDDSDTTSADNGGTIIVDANGARWKRVYNGPVNVEWFGAKGDGVTDDTAAIQAALTEASSTGAELTIPDGYTFRCAAGQSVTGGLILRGRGTIKFNDASQFGLLIDPARTVSTTVSAITSPFTYPAGTGIESGAAQLAVADATGFVRGGKCHLRSDDKFTWDATVNRAELVEISDISGTTVYLTAPLVHSYTTGIVLEQLNEAVVDIDGPTFSYDGDPSSIVATPTRFFAVAVQGAVSPKVRATFRDDVCGGLILLSAWRPEVDITASNLRTSPTVPYYGYGVAAYGATRGGTYNVKADRVRHAYTTGVWPTASEAIRWGTVMDDVVSGVCHNAQLAAWDTHPGAMNVTFLNPVTYLNTTNADQTDRNSAFGFQDRGLNTTFINPVSIGVRRPFSFSAGSTTYGADNTTRVLGGFHQRRHTTNVFLCNPSRTGTDTYKVEFTGGKVVGWVPVQTQSGYNILSFNGTEFVGDATATGMNASNDTGGVHYQNCTFREWALLRLGQSNNHKFLSCRRINAGAAVEPMLVGVGSTVDVADYYAEAASYGNNSIIRAGAGADAGAVTVNLSGNISAKGFTHSSHFSTNGVATLTVNTGGVTRQAVAKKNTTANRPTLLAEDVGYLYLDTTLDADGKPIWWTGAAWVDATGATV
jgi:hypothetical protein